MDRLVSEMPRYMLSGILDAAHSLTEQILTSFSRQIRTRETDCLRFWCELSWIDSCVQPDNTTLKDYGRLLKDGELKIRAHSDNRTKTRSVVLWSNSGWSSGLVVEYQTHNWEAACFTLIPPYLHLTTSWDVMLIWEY